MIHACSGSVPDGATLYAELADSEGLVTPDLVTDLIHEHTGLDSEAAG